MERLDLFSMIHKGIRAELFGTTQEVARTDFDDEAQIRAAAGRVRKLLGFLEEHAEHEDRDIMPQLAEPAPGVYSELHSDHVRLDALHHEVRLLVDRLETSAAHERSAWGRRLQERVSRLVAEHLLHMNKEETVANRALWAHRSDAELATVQGRIVGAIPPARMADWMDLVLPTLNTAERALLQARAADAPQPKAAGLL